MAVVEAGRLGQCCPGSCFCVTLHLCLMKMRIQRAQNPSDRPQHGRCVLLPPLLSWVEPFHVRLPPGAFPWQQTAPPPV